MNQNRKILQERIEETSSKLGLLSLNGMIEAKRAGEHGKGFSVVFDEVQKLQEEIRMATTELNKLSVLEDMKEAFSEFEEKVTNQETADKSFLKLERLMNEMKELMKIKAEKE